MLCMIANWQHSCVSMKRYCEEKGIDEATIYYLFSRSKENGACSGGFIAIDNSSTKLEVKVVYPIGCGSR